MIHEALYFEMGHTRAVCTKDWKYLAMNPEYKSQLKKMQNKLIQFLKITPGTFGELKRKE